MTDQQKVDDLLKAETVLGDKAADEVFDVDAAVAQFAVAVFLAAHFLLGAVHRGDLGKTREHALAVRVAQTALDIVLAVQRRINTAVRAAERRQRFHARRDL